MLPLKIHEGDAFMPVHAGITRKPLRRIRSRPVQLQGFEEFIVLLRMQLIDDEEKVGLAVEALGVPCGKDLDESGAVLQLNTVILEHDKVAEQGIAPDDLFQQFEI